MARGAQGAVPGDRIAVGVVTGAHGVRGGLRVRLYAAGGPLPEPGGTVAFVRGGSVLGAFALRRIAPVPGRPMARLFVDGVADRNGALALAGAEVEVPRTALPPLEPDEFYLADAVGRPVRGTVGGHPRDDLGTVVAVVEAGPNPLLEVRAEDGTTWYLSPSPAYVRAVGEDGVVVDLPEGMGPEDAAPGRPGRPRR